VSYSRIFVARGTAGEIAMGMPRQLSFEMKT
jgi:hypothetical protein